MPKSRLALPASCLTNRISVAAEGGPWAFLQCSSGRTMAVAAKSISLFAGAVGGWMWGEVWLLAVRALQWGGWPSEGLAKHQSVKFESWDPKEPSNPQNLLCRVLNAPTGPSLHTKPRFDRYTKSFQTFNWV